MGKDAFSFPMGRKKTPSRCGHIQPTIGCMEIDGSLVTRQRHTVLICCTICSQKHKEQEEERKKVSC